MGETINLDRHVEAEEEFIAASARDEVIGYVVHRRPECRAVLQYKLRTDPRFDMLPRPVWITILGEDSVSRAVICGKCREGWNLGLMVSDPNYEVEIFIEGVSMDIIRLDASRR